MRTRRTLCTGVILALAGCSGSDSPYPKGKPPVEIEYLSHRNATRVWYTGNDSWTDIEGHGFEKIYIWVWPEESSSSGSGGLATILEKDDRTVDSGLWASKENQAAGISRYPVPANDEVFVTAYSGRNGMMELESGDKVGLGIIYEESSLQNYPLIEVP